MKFLHFFTYPSGKNDHISSTNKAFRQIFNWVKIGRVRRSFTGGCLLPNKEIYSLINPIYNLSLAHITIFGLSAFWNNYKICKFGHRLNKCGRFCGLQKSILVSGGRSWSLWKPTSDLVSFNKKSCNLPQRGSNSRPSDYDYISN